MSFSHLMQMGHIIVAGSSLLKDVPLSDSTCGEFSEILICCIIHCKKLWNQSLPKFGYHYGFTLLEDHRILAKTGYLYNISNVDFISNE